MANTFTAPFVQSFKTLAAVATASVGGIGTDTVTGAVELVTGGANGSIVTAVRAMPRATATASSLLLFVEKAGAAGVFRLVGSALMPAYTLSATTAIPATEMPLSAELPLYLEAGDKLYAASQVALAAGIVFSASVGDL